MRAITKYTLKEWLRFDPALWYLKEKRNDWVSRNFIQKRPKELKSFLEDNQQLKGKTIATVVAFNSPWIIENLILAMKRYVKGAELLVCDNSNNPELRAEIADVCHAANVPYLALPENPEKHPCRSHGIAMNWIFYNLIQPLQPFVFACIDHDLIPFRPIRLEDLVKQQPVYGYFIDRKWAWSLWAGYAIYDFNITKNKAVNFNNDRAANLDTGGRNWKPIYRNLNKADLKFANLATYTIRHPKKSDKIEGYIFDDAWLHVMSVGQRKGRKDTFSVKAKFYADLFEHINKGNELSEYIQLADTIKADRSAQNTSQQP